MKDVWKGYEQILRGLIGLIALIPGIAILVAALTIIVKYSWQLILWIW